jgi:hypothetical protein
MADGRVAEAGPPAELLGLASTRGACGGGGVGGADRDCDPGAPPRGGGLFRGMVDALGAAAAADICDTARGAYAQRRRAGGRGGGGGGSDTGDGAGTDRAAVAATVARS